MKKQTNLHRAALSPHQGNRLFRWCCIVLAVLLSALPSARAELPAHDIAAANLDVIQNDLGNTAASVTVTAVTSINGFRMRDGSNRGDYNIQIGDEATDDVAGGILMTSVRENGGRDNGEGDGINFVISTIEMTTTTYTGANVYFIPTFGLGGGASREYNINVAAAHFPYSSWVGGWVRIAGGTNGAFGNGITNNEIIGTTGMSFGQNIRPLNPPAAGKLILDLSSFGYDSRTDGVLLVTGGKNEGNYALSQANTNDGTWNLFIKDKDSNAASTEEDPIAFVFIPKTNTTVVSGKFFGDGAIAIHSGVTPEFTVTNIGTGRYELKIPGRSIKEGVLIVSFEGGTSINQDNIVTYQLNDAGDGWVIESRDGPLNANNIIGLQSPPATDPVCSFVFIPGPTAGVTISPSSSLLTTENFESADFSVVLHKRPADIVTIDVSSSDLTEGVVSTSQLVFTPDDWFIPQTVTVTGQDDDLSDGSVAYSIILAPIVSNDPDYNGFDPADVLVVNADNEAGITISPTTGLVTTEAGGTATFKVRLNSAPAANVSFNLASSDVSEGFISHTSLTFTPDDWFIEQEVTITGLDDLVDDGDVNYFITTFASTSTDPIYNNLDALDISVTNLDDDTAGLVVSASGPSGLSVVEGGTNSYTVALNSEPTENVTVNIQSDNTVQGGTVSPASLLFTPANWHLPQTVTISGADDLVTDGLVSWTINHSATSADSTYATVAAVPVLMRTVDNEGVLTLPSGDLIYGVGLPGVGIDGRAGLSDPETPNYGGGNLTVTLTSNGASDDRLEIRNDGSGIGQIGVSGNTVSYQGTTIGTFSGGVGTTPLVVTLNSSATPQATEALIRVVTFRNVSGSPSLNTRTVSFVVTDNDGGVSSATKAIRVGLLRATSFQEGADYGYGPYSGQRDTYLREADPLTPYPAGNANGQLFVDFPEIGGTGGHVLMAFDQIFGDGPGQVPTNAIIVSADLMVTIADTGHASPLYRMLRDWDATNETWDSIGSGVDQDDIESHSFYDSQIGTTFTAGATGLGTISVSVLPDVEIWRSGVEPNFGWVLPGYVGNNNGTGILPSEALNVSDRPRLRVLWVPEGTAVATFRQDVNGYTGTVDTQIRQVGPDADYSTATSVGVDAVVTGSAPNPQQVLLRFDNIIGNSEGQVPPNAQIHAAVLDLGALVSDAMGHGGTFHRMLQTWEDTSTWNTLSDGVSADDVEAVATPTAVAGTAQLTPLVQGGYLTYELTPDVQAWAHGAPNYGWAILPWPGGGNGWFFGTSEAFAERERPQLRVYYTPGVAQISIQSVEHTSTAITIKFTGEIGATYSVRRSETVDGVYGVIGSAEVQPNGTATFVDNAPLSNAAFYRISNP